MTGKPKNLADLPPELTAVAQRENLLQLGLKGLPLTGAIFLRSDFTSPWAYDSPMGREVAAMLKQVDRSVILFHIVAEGRCRVALGDGAEIEPSAGDVVILPAADQHRMSSREPAQAVPLGTLIAPPPWASMPMIRHGGGGELTRIVCGYLCSDEVPFNAVMSTLPPLIHVRAAGGPLAKWIESSVHYALDQTERPGADSDPLLQRLPELLFMEALRHYVRHQPPSETGWLAATADPIVARALAYLHHQPEHDWSLNELAERAGASRSVLDERFRSLLGRAPMTYLAGFRLELAARELRTTDKSVAEIGAGVGYGTEASFSRAFKRQIGVSPSHWRGRRQAV
jgi:AraC-like DNA-binding protein